MGEATAPPPLSRLSLRGRRLFLRLLLRLFLPPPGFRRRRSSRIPTPGRSVSLFIYVFSPLQPPDTVIRAGPAGILSPHRPHTSIACPLSRTSNLSVRSGRHRSRLPPRASRPAGRRYPPLPGPLAAPQPGRAPLLPCPHPSGALSRRPENGDWAPGDPLLEDGRGPHPSPRSPLPCPCPGSRLAPAAAAASASLARRSWTCPSISEGVLGRGLGIGVHWRSERIRSCSCGHLVKEADPGL